MKISIPTPDGFDFKRTMLSHGWCTLLPCECDQENWTLTRVFDLNGQLPISGCISASKGRIEINISRSRIGEYARKRITRDVRHMFRLDDDMTEFYRTVSSEPNLAWIARVGAGRMLRSPTVFEDLVKTICTTNCSWSLTVKMVAGLTTNLGIRTRDGRRTFPSPEIMAEAPASFYRDEMRAGYRAPYFKELAERVASGELDVENWVHSELPTDELKREIKGVKGVGDYSAENLLKLLGRFDGLALDSWLRARFFKVHNNGRVCSDKKIARHYLKFQSWRGLALWCDMTKDWIEDQG